MKCLFLSAAIAATIATASPNSRSVYVFGDSFSAGDGSDLANPDLWPVRLEKRLDANGRDWSVANKSINGNGLIFRTKCFGDPATVRAEAELPGLPVAATVIVMAGVNDVIQPFLKQGTSTCFEPRHLTSVELAAGLSSLRGKVKAQRLIVATIPPFKASEFHSAQAEAVRSGFNKWLVANWPKRDLIRLDRLLASPSDDQLLDRQFDSGDGLHPNAKGARRIADEVARMLES